MAKRIVTTLTDDLDPEVKATGTVVFTVDGVQYEIDLSDEHREQMRAALEPFIVAARPVGGRRRAARKATPPSTAVPAEGSSSGSGTAGPAEPDVGAVRAWANEHGIAVSKRGRIKGSVVAQFLEAHG